MTDDLADLRLRAGECDADELRRVAATGNRTAVEVVDELQQ